ncbi:MAG: glycosyltransferase family A protein [Neisseria sp.]|nr:glycosyltransferase family A protein [Neisseria sp.]
MNKTQTGLDVVIPCFNAEATLERAVESALRQPEATRIWLVDDGSTDGTANLIDRLKNRHPRIKAETMPQNGGAAKARNWAALQSSADIIAFLDADDEYEDGALAAPLFVFAHYPEIALVRQKLCPVGLPDHYRRTEGFSRAWQSLEMTVGGNMVFRRSIFLAAGGFPQHELFRRLGGEDAALGIAFTRCSVVATLFGEHIPGVTHYLHQNAHAWKLLDTSLFGKAADGITPAEQEQAEAVTQQIAERIRSLQNILAVEQTGICPITVEYAEA